MPDQEKPSSKLKRLLDSEADTQSEPPVEDVTPVSGSRPFRRVAVDENGMPLPRRVDEIDVGATRVSPAAYLPPAAAVKSRKKGSNQHRKVPGRKKNLVSGSCLLQGLIISLFLLVGLGLILAAVGIYEYYTIASTLPSVGDLQQHASQFETTHILDRNGRVLYEITDPNAGRRTYVPLQKISPLLIAATLSTEDKDFYTHGGYDPWAILRAFWQNITSGETVSGASTITQQLARALLFSPEERGQRTYLRKVREALLSAEIERRYSKDAILELYLNEIYYGNLAYGVEAAAETYFNISASQLTMAQAVFLAGLPQAPSVYDIFSNRDVTLVRYQDVILGMVSLSLERGCIYVSTSPDRVCMDGTAAAQALDEIKEYSFNLPQVVMRYPHWVQYIRTLLEERYDPQTIYRSGFSVYTSLDPEMQDAAQQAISTQVAALVDKNVNGGALVAIKPATGEILAMVGSPDFYNEANAGQINMAVSQTRQPGSSIKPFTYLAAFEKGWTPSTLIWDVPSEFTPSGLPSDPNPPYIPSNFSMRFAGPVPLRLALANSLNVPAVKTLQFVGVYDDPATPARDGLIAMAERLGITSLNRPDYGLSLTLGGGEVSLLEMTAGFSVIANGGLKVSPVAILKIVDFQGNVIFEYEPPAGEQVLRPEHAYLMASILADNAARSPVFGANSVLNLSFQAAVKTGTSNDTRDNWTIGFTPDLVTGVWVGNPDYSPMINTSGVTGAGPIWAEVMTYGIGHLTGNNPSPFIRPENIKEYTICAISGTEPSRWCPETAWEIYASDQPPLSAEHDLWREVKVDTWTNLEASEECKEFTEDLMMLNVDDESARKWIVENEAGRDWARDMGFEDILFAPDHECRASDPRPRLAFIGLIPGETITQPMLDIIIIADASAFFRSWRLEGGVGESPQEWMVLIPDSTFPIREPARVGTLNLVDLPSGPITLKLYMQSTGDGYADMHMRLNLNIPTPTRIPSATPSQTPSFTPSLTPTSTPLPSATSFPTVTLIPSDTPTVELVETPTP